jgi:hypothetical protein
MGVGMGGMGSFMRAMGGDFGFGMGQGMGATMEGGNGGGIGVDMGATMGGGNGDGNVQQDEAVVQDTTNANANVKQEHPSNTNNGNEERSWLYCLYIAFIYYVYA